MRKYNWFVVRHKVSKEIIRVRQAKPFSDVFLNEKGDQVKIQEIDMTIKLFLFDKTDDEVESGLDGYRAIYG